MLTSVASRHPRHDTGPRENKAHHENRDILAPMVDGSHNSGGSRDKGGGAIQESAREDTGGAKMNTPEEDSEATGRTRTPKPSGDDGSKYYYYVSQGHSPHAVFICDHAYDCESLSRTISEQEAVALIGTDALRAAQDECSWNGLGSKRLLVYEGQVLYGETDPTRVGAFPTPGEWTRVRMS